MDHRGHEPGAGRTERVPESNGAALRIRACWVGACFRQPGSEDRRKRFVHLEGVDVVDPETRFGEHGRRRRDRAGQHREWVGANDTE